MVTLFFGQLRRKSIDSVLRWPHFASELERRARTFHTHLLHSAYRNCELRSSSEEGNNTFWKVTRDKRNGENSFQHDCGVSWGTNQRDNLVLFFRVLPLFGPVSMLWVFTKQGRNGVRDKFLWKIGRVSTLLYLSLAATGRVDNRLV